MAKPKSKVVVRMAPSPTGYLHVGSVRTTLFNYLFARHNGGKFILRSEDTDKERSKKEYEDDIINGLKWLGLTWDEFYRQSERTDIYVSYVKKMIENGSAYISKEEPKEEGQRSEVVRFKNPKKKIAFDDLVRGHVEFDTTDLGDFVIARSETEPLYHLAVVVDDHEMGVTHVLRGEEHISNTPRQILIQEAIGAERPIYGHLSLILDSEKKKLSKRKHGAAVWIDTYKKEGFLPDALLNYFAFLGWNPGTEKEIFTLAELVEAFDVAHLQKAGAVFDTKKLRWVNKEHMKLNRAEVYREIEAKLKARYKESIDPKLVNLVFERIEVLGDVDGLISNGELDYFFEDKPQLSIERIAWKNSSPEKAREHLKHVLPLITEPEKIMAYADRVGKGDVLWPLRYALTGKERSPDPITVIEIKGEERSRSSILSAINKLTEQ